MFRFRRGAKDAALFERGGGTPGTRRPTSTARLDPYEIRAVQDVIDRHRTDPSGLSPLLPVCPGHLLPRTPVGAETTPGGQSGSTRHFRRPIARLKVRPELEGLTSPSNPPMPPALVGVRENERKKWLGSMGGSSLPGEYPGKDLAVPVGRRHLSTLAYNRWGIVGDFLVFRLSVVGNWLNLTEPSRRGYGETWKTPMAATCQTNARP